MRDPAPALYVLQQRFSDPSGRELRRVGFFGALRLEDYERRVVLPHERTLRGPKDDRLRQLRATRTNLSAVFLLYEDPERRARPRARGGARRGHRGEREGRGGRGARPRRGDGPLGCSSAPRRFLAPRPVVIADGHHRYETALAYRDERRAEAGAARARPSSGRSPTSRRLRAGHAAPPDPPGGAPRSARPRDAAWRAALPGWEERRVAGRAARRRIADTARARRSRPSPIAMPSPPTTGRGRSASSRARRTASSRCACSTARCSAASSGLGDDAVREGAVAFPKSRPRARAHGAGR